MSYVYWIFRAFWLYPLSQCIASMREKNFSSALQILLQFKVNNIENKMTPEGFCSKGLFAGRSPAVHIPLRFCDGFSVLAREELVQRSPHLLTPCNSVALFPVPCRKVERGEEGRGRGERERDCWTLSDHLLLLRSDSAAFTLLSLLALFSGERKRRRRKG